MKIVDYDSHGIAIYIPNLLGTECSNINSYDINGLKFEWWDMEKRNIEERIEQFADEVPPLIIGWKCYSTKKLIKALVYFKDGKPIIINEQNFH